MTLNQFIDRWNGKGADFDGWYGDQCVDLFNFYNQDVVGAGRLFTSSTGGAADLYNDFNGPGNTAYIKVANSPDGAPHPGDVVIWKANGKLTGPAGHVAVFVEGDAQQFTSFDQNWPTGSQCHLQRHDYTDVLGWLHVKANQGGSTVAETYKSPVNGDARDAKGWYDAYAARDKDWYAALKERDNALKLAQTKQDKVDELVKANADLTEDNDDLIRENKQLSDENATQLAQLSKVEAEVKQLKEQLAGQPHTTEPGQTTNAVDQSFDISKYRKAIVAFIGVAVTIATTILGPDNQILTSIVCALTVAGVYAVPNKGTKS